ncbi:MAG: phosphatidate cytidylyltransferase [Chloroflexi bacterium]|nr:phosphatidate cytidylyltransferase [Chloroflexota bacterium]
MTTTQNKEEQGLSNLAVRVLTALVGGPLALAVSYIGGLLFGVVVALLAALAALEFYALGRDRQMPGSGPVGILALAAALAAFEFRAYGLLPPLAALAAAVVYLVERARRTPSRLSAYRALVTLAGLVYIGLPSAFLIAVRGLPDGFHWLALALALTWGTDTLAYAGGRLWGKHLLAPAISPKKTVEGAVVGMAGGLLCGLAWAAATGLLSAGLLPLLALAPPVAVLGDLLESRIKRFFHAGDSHLARLNVIPGHGGVLDRIDSLIAVAVLFYAYIALTGIAG